MAANLDAYRIESAAEERGANRAVLHGLAGDIGQLRTDMGMIRRDMLRLTWIAVPVALVALTVSLIALVIVLLLAYSLAPLRLPAALALLLAFPPAGPGVLWRRLPHAGAVAVPLLVILGFAVALALLADVIARVF